MNRIVAEARWMKAILVLVLAGIFGCTGNVGKRTPDHNEKITIAVTPWPASAPIYVAQDEGYFQNEGLDVTLDSYLSGHLGLAAVLSGKADFATVGETPITRAAVDGKPVTVVATISQIDRAIRIIARKDRGISASGDLRGKKIGVVAGTTAQFFLRTYLATAFISPRDVQIIYVETDKLVDALLNGDVDAVSTWSPFTLVLRDRFGSNAVILDEPNIYTMTWNVTTTQEFAKNNPERVKAFLRAILRANSFIKENPDEARTLSAKHIGTDSPLYEGEWGDYDFTMELDQSLILNMEDQARWMFSSENRSARPVPDLADFIYADGLKAVQPGAVTIVGK